MWATQFNALITVSSVFIASVLASNLGGILPGILGGMVPVVSGWHLSACWGNGLENTLSAKCWSVATQLSAYLHPSGFSQP